MTTSAIATIAVSSRTEAASAGVSGNLVACGLRYVLGGEPEFRKQAFERGRGAEGVHPDRGAAPPHIPLPSDGGRLLDSSPGSDRVRQHGLAIGLVLLFEQRPRRHAENPRRTPGGGQLVVVGNAERHFAARPDQDDLRRRAAEIRQQALRATPEAGANRVRSNVGSGCQLRIRAAM